MTKDEIQEIYKLSSDFSYKMFCISIKNLFVKEKITEAHWLDDKRWWNLPYEED